MEVVEPEYNTAAAAMRLQTPYLHSVHREILDHLIENHEKVIVLLGMSPVRNSVNNPLDYEQRLSMLLEAYPDIIVLKDEMVEDDEVWSRRLDKEIKSVLTPTDTVVLYGGRKSFIPHYTGKFPTRELDSDTVISATEIRRGIHKSRLRTADARAGIVWASANRYPTSYTAVDIAIFNEDETKILLGRKEHAKQFRFIGGFVDPTDKSFEAAARREVQEETGLAITDPEYVGSFRVDDWRYRLEQDKIMSATYRAKVQFGSPRPDDDIAEVKWFEVIDLLCTGAIERLVVPTHHKIMEAVLNDHLKRKRGGVEQDPLEFWTGADALIYCKHCTKTHSVKTGEQQCSPGAWIHEN